MVGRKRNNNHQNRQGNRNQNQGHNNGNNNNQNRQGNRNQNQGHNNVTNNHHTKGKHIGNMNPCHCCKGPHTAISGSCPKLRGKTCNTCGVPNHTVKYCVPNKGQKKNEWRNLDTVMHDANASSANSWSGGSGYNANASNAKYCHWCNMKNHTSEDCSKKAHDNTSLQCFKCGGAGHKAKQCCNPNSQSSNSNTYTAANNVPCPTATTGLEAAFGVYEPINNAYVTPVTASHTVPYCHFCNQDDHTNFQCTNYLKIDAYHTSKGPQCSDCGYRRHIKKECKHPNRRSVKSCKDHEGDVSMEDMAMRDMMLSLRGESAFHLGWKKYSATPFSTFQSKISFPDKIKFPPGMKPLPAKDCTPWATLNAQPSASQQVPDRPKWVIDFVNSIQPGAQLNGWVSRESGESIKVDFLGGLRIDSHNGITVRQPKGFFQQDIPLSYQPSASFNQYHRVLHTKSSVIIICKNRKASNRDIPKTVYVRMLEDKHSYHEHADTVAQARRCLQPYCTRCLARGQILDADWEEDVSGLGTYDESSTGTCSKGLVELPCKCADLGPGKNGTRIAWTKRSAYCPWRSSSSEEPGTVRELIAEGKLPEPVQTLREAWLEPPVSLRLFRQWMINKGLQLNLPTAAQKLELESKNQGTPVSYLFR